MTVLSRKYFFGRKRDFSSIGIQISGRNWRIALIMAVREGRKYQSLIRKKIGDFCMPQLANGRYRRILLYLNGQVFSNNNIKGDKKMRLNRL